jgi:casein kinase II subunit alpha
LVLAEQLSESSIYACEQKIGRGKYSEVFLSTNLNNSEKCVVKMLKPSTSPPT